MTEKVMVKWRIAGFGVIDGKNVRRAPGDEDIMPLRQAERMQATGHITIVGPMDKMAHKRSALRPAPKKGKSKKGRKSTKGKRSTKRKSAVELEDES
jgi:hypothetical protein